MAEIPIKLPSNAKGKRASFYQDPAVDQLFSIITMLTQELSVTYDRIESLERVLENKGTITRQEVEDWIPGEKEELERTKRREALISRVFHIMHEEAESLANPR